MASPSIRSSIKTDGTTATTTPVVSLPATIAAGDTIFVVIRNAVAGAIGWPDATWNELFDASADSDDDQQAAAWKKADGSEGGTTITLSSGNGKFAACAWAIRDAADPTIRAPELSTVATGATPTQANATTVTPTGGSKDYLFLTFVGIGGEPTVPPTYPTSYTLGQLSGSSGTGGLPATNCCVAGAGQQKTAASEDAAAWSYAGTFAAWTAYTAAFHPATAVDTPLQTEWLRANPWAKKPTAMTMLSIGLGLMQSTLFVAPQPFNQDHWPIPQGKGSLEITTETRPPDDAAIAFSQQDWPNPQGKPFFLEGRTWTINLQESTLAPTAAVATPVVPIAWPNPISRRAWPLGTNGYTPGPGPAPFTATDWPLPKASPCSLRGFTLDGRREVVVAAAAPFSQNEWLTPRSREYPISLRTALDSRKPYHVDLTPAHLTDWPNPKPIPAASVLRGFTDQPRLVLVDTIYGAPGQVPDYDWPIPGQKPSLRTLQTWTLELQQSTLPLVTPAPFALTDWPIVRTVPRVLDLRTATTNLQQSTLFVTVEKPFNLGDWPNPRGKDFPIGLRTSTDGRKAYHVDLTPSHLTDWPLPVGKPLSLELRTTLENLLESTLGQGTPFAQDDWQNPQGKGFPISLRTWLDYRNRSLVEPLPDGRQTEWPIPRDGGRVIDLRTWAGNLQESTLAIIVPYPFSLTDWPLAQGKAFPVTLRTFLDWRNRSLIEPLPDGRQTDWPLAARGVYVPLQLRTHVAWRALSLVDPLPTGRLLDWPNPRGPKAAEDLRTWLQNLQEGTLGPAPPPFSLRDWPNPTGKTFPIALRTITQWRPLGILDAVPVHLTDWPNPQGKPYPVTLRTWSKGEWLTIAGLVVQVPATADYLVLMPAGDAVVRMPSTDGLIRYKATDIIVKGKRIDCIVLIPEGDGVIDE